MHFLSLRTTLIRNIPGTHDQIIEANVPTFLTEPLHEAAYAAGCVPCSEAGVPNYDIETPAPQAEAPAVEEAPAYTLDEVKAAIEELIAENNSSSFGVNGRPKIGVVARKLGHRPTAVEVSDAWDLIETE